MASGTANDFSDSIQKGLPEAVFSYFQNRKICARLERQERSIVLQNILILCRRSFYIPGQINFFKQFVEI